MRKLAGVLYMLGLISSWDASSGSVSVALGRESSGLLIVFYRTKLNCVLARVDPEH